MSTPLITMGQNTCIKGHVMDRITQKGIPSATIKLSGKAVGTSSDSTGYFELCLGQYFQDPLEISHTAYETTFFSKPNIASQQNVIIWMDEKNIQTDEVTVTGTNYDKIRQIFAGKDHIKQEDILSLPTILGEADVVKAVQLSAGVQSVSEGQSGIFVRGGGAGQNLFILDDMELMNPNHLMGIYSVFNPLTTSDVEIHKGHAPVDLQGRLSSTIAVQSRTPQPEDCGLEGNIGNLSSNLAWSGLSQNQKFSITTGLRRSYLEAYCWMTSGLIPEEKNYFKNNAYAFYDWNGKISGQLAPSTQLNFSWYMGNDHFKIKNQGISYDASTRWGNNCATLSLKHFTPNGDCTNHSISFANTYSGFEGSLINNLIDLNSQFTQLSFKNQWTHSTENNLINAGIDLTWSHTKPEDFHYIYINDTVDRVTTFKNAISSIYIGDKIQLSKNSEFYVGLRLNNNLSLGPYDYYQSDGSIEQITDGDIANQSWSWSAISALSIQIQTDRWIKFAFSRNVQQVHLASISSIPLPNDIWVSATPKLEPETGIQLSAGLYRKHQQWEWSAEIYGKHMQHLLIYQVNMNKEDQQNFEDNFLKGKGIAYGLDLSITKKKGMITGSVNYSLSHSQRSFPTIYDGIWFNDKYDRIHDLNIQANFKLNAKWDFGMLWVFATGNTTTLPSGRWWMMGSVMNDYTGYNNFRFPPYHRLDISINRRLLSKQFKESILNFSIINLYNRANPYFLYYKVYMGENQYDIDIKATQISLFPIMPSVSWRFKF